MKLYKYCQNNSGGSYDLNKDLHQYVYIQAHNHQEANERAEDLGIYFNGCASGQDCSCCGDRWWPVDDDDAIESKTGLLESLYWDKEYSRKGDIIAIIHTLDDYRHTLYKYGGIISEPRYKWLPAVTYMIEDVSVFIEE